MPLRPFLLPKTMVASSVELAHWKEHTLLAGRGQRFWATG